jgi:hypothetical protein
LCALEPRHAGLGQWFAKQVDLFCLCLPIGLKATLSVQNRRFIPHKLDKDTDKVYINVIQKILNFASITGFYTCSCQKISVKQCVIPTQLY